MNKNPFFASSHKFYLNGKKPKSHWVGKPLMKLMDVDELFNIRVIICSLEERLNDDNAIDASGITEGQTETSVIA